MRKCFFIWIVVCFSVYAAFAQQNLQLFVDFHMDSDTLIWTDTLGQNLFLLEQSEEVWNEEEGTSSRSLRATHWLVVANQREERWSFEDGIAACLVDIEAKFLAAPRFTDLDGDGIYEVWFIFQKACKGDVSPSEITVVMVDKGREPRRLLGEQLLVFPDGTTDGGNYDLVDFQTLPKTYQEYALYYLLANYRFEYR